MLFRSDPGAETLPGVPGAEPGEGVGGMPADGAGGERVAPGRRRGREDALLPDPLAPEARVGQSLPPLTLLTSQYNLLDSYAPSTCLI